MFEGATFNPGLLDLVIGILVLLFIVLIFKSIYSIGPTQIGLVRKRFGAKLPGDNPVAFKGEAGYQAQLLMPGLRFKFCLIYAVAKHPWVQVPAGQIGVVISQVGEPTPIGAKSGVYKSEFGNFTDVSNFVAHGGQKGVQRPVLSPGMLAPIHPVAFLVITKPQVFGVPISDTYRKLAEEKGRLTFEAFGLEERQLEVTRIALRPAESGKVVDMIGIVTALEGQPLPAGAIASRLGTFEDVEALEKKPDTTDFQLIAAILGSKNTLHNNYQDFQQFLDAGGKIGLQHDPLLYGAYNLNPFLVRVEQVPMLVVEQGQVAVIKAYVGLPTQDTSGVGFKFGSLVRPGHQGIWQEALRTGKYPINPRIYDAKVVLTAILKLDWAKDVTGAHGLDARLEPIIAKSNEGFVFSIDLQVLIHVPDTKAPRVISMVGSMENLVNEVLQAAVGNLFRDKIGGMEAIKFIQTRQIVQEEAFEYIQRKLSEYEIETRGVYIQDVIYPAALVTVLTEREVAHQQVETFKMQRQAQDQRIETEKAHGTADMQAQLAQSAVGVDIKRNNAEARKAEADGEAAFIERTGTAQGAQVRAVGLARAEAYRKQVEALGPGATALVNAIEALSRSNVPFMPNTLVTGGGGSVGGVLEGLGALLMQKVGPGGAIAPSVSVNPGVSSAPAQPVDAAAPTAPAPPPSKSPKL
ncbi:MAG: SPFH domain-containing protein [Terracidiphilus sp.]|jgi:regulator of protease activity HflC (stomatin/prohibitin superfamily)